MREKWASWAKLEADLKLATRLLPLHGALPKDTARGLDKLYQEAATALKSLVDEFAELEQVLVACEPRRAGKRRKSMGAEKEAQLTFNPVKEWYRSVVTQLQQETTAQMNERLQRLFALSGKQLFEIVDKAEFEALDANKLEALLLFDSLVFLKRCRESTLVLPLPRLSVTSLPHLQPSPELSLPPLSLVGSHSLPRSGHVESREPRPLRLPRARRQGQSAARHASLRSLPHGHR